MSLGSLLNPTPTPALPTLRYKSPRLSAAAQKDVVDIYVL